VLLVLRVLLVPLAPLDLQVPKGFLVKLALLALLDLAFNAKLRLALRFKKVQLLPLSAQALRLQLGVVSTVNLETTSAFLNLPSLLITRVQLVGKENATMELARPLLYAASQEVMTVTLPPVMAVLVLVMAVPVQVTLVLVTLVLVTLVVIDDFLPKVARANFSRFRLERAIVY